MRLLLLTGPMVQVNTPYPATAYLKGFLDSRFTDGSVVTLQADPAVDLCTRMFSRDGLSKLRDAVKARRIPEILFFKDAFADYARHVESVVAYLQNKSKDQDAVIDPKFEAKLAAR